MIFGLIGIPLIIYNFFNMLMVPLTLNIEKRRDRFTILNLIIETTALTIAREIARVLLGGWSTIYTDSIICFIIYAIYAYIFFFKSFALGTLYAVMMHLAGTSSGITSIFLIRLLDSPFLVKHYLISIGVSSLLINAVMYVIFSYFKPTLAPYLLISIPILSFLVAVVIYEISLFPQDFTEQHNLFNEDLAYMNIIIVINMSSTFIFFFYISAAGYSKKIADATVSKEFAVMESIFSSNFKKTYQEMLSLRHDFRNHLIALDLLVQEKQYTEIDDYIQMINERYVELEAVVQSGNFVIDAIVNTKLTDARDRGFVIQVSALAPASLKMKTPDIISLLGNLLDNAIESTERVKLKDPEFTLEPITVDIQVVAKQLIILVSNSAKMPPRKVNGRYRTSKPRRTYGIGLSTIDNIVNSYNGVLYREFEDALFTTKILLPISY